MFFAVSPGLLQAMDFNGPAKYSSGRDASFTPQYSALYEQLLTYEKQSRYLEALRIIPDLYDQEIQPESYYLALEEKRLQLLGIVAQNQISFEVGREKVTCNDVRKQVWGFYHRNPKTYRFIPPLSAAIGSERLCNLLIVLGSSLDMPTMDTLLVNPSLALNLQEVLTSSDPWLVSGGMFLSRQEKLRPVSLQAVVNRWQKQPYLWDDHCTVQALYLAAGSEPAELKSLVLDNEDIRHELDGLYPVPAGKAYIAPLLFVQTRGERIAHTTSGLTLVRMKKKAERSGGAERGAAGEGRLAAMDVVEKRDIVSAELVHGAIPVEPGWYRFEFNSVPDSFPERYSGRSSVIRVKSGTLVVLPVQLAPVL